RSRPKRTSRRDFFLVRSSSIPDGSGLVGSAVPAAGGERTPAFWILATASVLPSRSSDTANNSTPGESGGQRRVRVVDGERSVPAATAVPSPIKPAPQDRWPNLGSSTPG